jgi:hypothetical protein
MTGIQMILTIGAFILLMLVIVSVNSRTLSTEDVMYDSNFGITATSIASSIIEDASKKRFDNIYYIDSSTVYDPNDFTSVADLGVDSAEDKSDPKTFNDFDDYNGYSAQVDEMAKETAIFHDSCVVSYVNAVDGQLDTKSNSQTFHKKITVFVWSKSMKDTIVMSSIYSYWNFLP